MGSGPPSVLWVVGLFGRQVVAEGAADDFGDGHVVCVGVIVELFELLGCEGEVEAGGVALASSRHTGILMNVGKGSQARSVSGIDRTGTLLA